MVRRSAAMAGQRYLPAAALGLVPAVFLLLMVVAPLWRLAAEAAAGTSTGMLLAMWHDNYLRWRVFWSLLQALGRNPGGAVSAFGRRGAQGKWLCSAGPLRIGLSCPSSPRSLSSQPGTVDPGVPKSDDTTPT